MICQTGICLKEEADIAIAMMEEQLHSNTKLIQSLNKDIEAQTSIIDSIENAIVSMKIHEERLKSAFNATSEQNTILQKELSKTKLKNGTLDGKLHNMKKQNQCLERLKSEERTKKNNQQLLLMKENEKAAFEANTITFAKLMTEQAVKISLSQLQEEQKICQKENQIANLSKEIDIKQNENEAIRKQHLELEEKFHSADASVKELIEDLIGNAEEKSSSCLYQPRIKRVTVTFCLRWILYKMNREFSDLA
ncbi:uncharacterized protein LOC130646128 [Hydractinia symbiolongicarpus]|uniref:uncharacterized protein LOC130646128 n=1 Tax=Hydractinia symbiolongicarpus TaxID=13093 RepID=UPI00254DB51B|nr:uncharacterized protein LOC130646128 [Hydractinia symbiolongicarpus]